MSWRQKTVSALAKALGVGAYGGAFDKPGFGVTASGLARPYEQSTWIQAALNLVTQPIKSVPLKFYEGDVEVEDAVLAAFFRAPALGMSREEWLDSTGGWSKLAGEFFWILDDTWLVRRGVKSPILAARPSDMRQIVVAGELVGWEYRDGEGRRIPLIPEQVIQRKRWNPWNRWRGLGELNAAKLAAETDYLAGQFARDSYANAGEQGDYLTSEGAAPTEAQQAQIVAALREKRAAKLRGEFRPVFLSGGIKVAPSTVSGPDANMVANRLQSRHEVFIAFGVPASMADVQASYSIGSASDYFRLIHGTCMPLAAMIAEAAGLLARKLTGRDLTAEFDWDEHPVMQAVRSERIEAAAKLFSLGVPLQAANDYLDMGLKPVPGWDQGWLPFSLQPAGGTLPAAPAEAGTNGTDTTNGDAVAVMLRELEARA
jgi:phage portal protein BeeE